MKKCFIILAAICIASLANAQAIKFEFSNIRFKTGSATIEPATYPALDTLGQFLKRSGARVEVAGHTDNVGNKRKNQKLSQQRAQAVCKYLIARHKIAVAQLTAKGYGDLMPLVPNLTSEERAKNRRVEITVLSKIRTARLSYLQGGVFVRKQGITRYAPAELDQVLTILDEIVTDSTSRAEVTFDNGSRIKINPRSDLVLDELSWAAGDKQSKISLKINAGKIYAKINQLSGQKDIFSVATPTAVAGIRGTDFVLESQPDLTALLSVWDGNIAWRGSAQNSPERAVAAAQGSICRAGQAPEPPVALPKPPMPQAPTANDTFYYNPDKAKSIKFVWKNNPGSRTHLVVSRDFDLRDVVADIITDKESFTLTPGKSDDAYYWMLTSISPEGLEGQPWPTRTLKLMRKVEKPRLKIMKPGMGEKTGQTKLTVSGQAEPKSVVTVNGKETSVSAEGDFTEIVLLKAGENMVTVEAADRAGNVSTNAIKVYCSPLHKFELIPYAGTVKLLGGIADASAVGFAGGLKMSYNIDQNYGLGLLGGYGQVGCNADNWEPRADEFSATVIPVGAWTRYLLLPDYKICPYTMIEAGAVFWKNSLAGSDFTSGTAPFGSMSVGVKFGLNEKTSLMAEATATYLAADTVNVGSIDKNNLMAGVQLGVIFGF
jgi:hypothetical protein